MRGGRRRALVSLTALVFGAGLVTPAVAEQRAVAHFVVLGVEGKPLARVEAAVAAAGGQVVRGWHQIGVVLAESPDAGFAAAVRGRPGVVAAGNTRDLVELTGGPERRGERGLPVTAFAGPVPAARTGAEPLADYQWNLRMIGADRAHEITDGNRDVVVGVLDTRMHVDNADLAPNIDARASVSCADRGIPNTARDAWTAPADAPFAHATAVGGVVAAARNGIGVAGVAPGVRIAAIALTDDGFVYPEQLICGYLWAAEHGVDVTNASFFVDPWVRWCDDDPDQAAAATAMIRAIDYAADRDVVNVSALGNVNWDLSHPVVDPYSPVNGDPVERLTGDDCVQVPGEVPGVVAASGVGAATEKARYSNYGIRDTDVTAPSGDPGQLPDTPDRNPGVLTPVNLTEWAYFGGTSAASPHVAGVAALLRATHPGWSARRVVAELTRAADRVPCPAGGVYDPDGTGAWLAHCEGGRSGRGFYGAGLVDAHDAVRR